MKAYVTKVQIGNLEIDGLMDEEGNYFVAIPQMVALNLVPPNRSQKQLESLLGLVFSSHVKLKTELNSKVVSAISIRDFERVLAKLDRAGNKFAQDLRDSLVGLTLHQLYSDAFGVKFEAEDRKNWLIERVEGKEVRRTLTDSIHDYLVSQGKGDAFGYYARITNQIYQGIFGLDANQIREQLGVTGNEHTRDHFNSKEIRIVASVEDLVMDYIDNGMNPFEAVAMALSLKKKKARLTLQGK
jgi:hypothetical protein